MANSPYAMKSAWSGKRIPGRDNNSKRTPGMSPGMDPGGNAQALRAMLPMPGSMGQQRAGPVGRPMQRPAGMPRGGMPGFGQQRQIGMPQPGSTPGRGAPGAQYAGGGAPAPAFQQVGGMGGMVAPQADPGDAYYAPGGPADQAIGASTTGTVVPGGAAPAPAVPLSFQNSLEQQIQDFLSDEGGYGEEEMAIKQAEIRDQVQKDYAMQQWQLSQQLGARGMGMSGAWLTGQQALAAQEEAVKTKAINDLMMQDQELKAQRAAVNAQLMGSSHVATMQADQAYDIWEKEFGPNLAGQGFDMYVAAIKAGLPPNVALKAAEEWMEKWTPGPMGGGYADDADVPPEVQAQKPYYGTGIVQDSQGNNWMWDGAGWKLMYGG